MSNNQQGFTLLEWLMSLSIGIVLLNITTKLSINLYKTQAHVKNILEIHENAELAFDTLTRDIRMSGFIGCPHFNDVVIPESPYRLQHRLMGFNAKCCDPRFRGFVQKASKNSDVLCLQYADPHRENVLYAKGNTLKLNQAIDFNAKEILLISNCLHAEIVQFACPHIQHTYQEDATISRFYRVIYYVAPTRRQNAVKQTIYALYRKDLNTPDQPTELVENVEKLEVYYGIVNGSSLVEHVPAHQVTNWSEVRSVTPVLHLTSTNAMVQPSGKAQPMRKKIQQTIMVRA